jgi:hypothetical protein
MTDPGTPPGPPPATPSGRPQATPTAKQTQRPAQFVEEPCMQGTKCVAVWVVWLLILAIVLIAAALLYAIWIFWPSEVLSTKGGVVSSVAPKKTVHYIWGSHVFSRESLFFVIVALAGALGGMVHTVKSFGWYAGQRALRWSWVPFYFLRPLLGAALATVLYFVVRAGFFSPSASTQQASPYGFAALAALTGLFADQAVEKLKRVAEEFFTQAPKGKDTVGEEPLARTGPTGPVGTNDATVTGFIDPKGHETTYRFEYGESDQYGQETTQETVTGVGEVKVEVRLLGLKPATTYHYRLVAQSEAGIGYGDDQNFVTQNV